MTSISSKPIPLHALAVAVGAVFEPASTRDRWIDRVASPVAAGPTSLLFAEDESSLQAAQSSAAAAVLTTALLAAKLPASGAGPVLLVCRQPKLLFARAARLLRAASTDGGIHPLASIAPTAQIAEDAAIAAFAVVGEHAVIGRGSSIGAGAVIGEGCVLGPECTIYPRAVLYAGVLLGARVILHAGAVIGSDGFGYVRDADTGEYVQFPQQGRLVIEDDVEIGANTTVDRGALEETRIRRGTKLDNLVHIGHNVDVGEQVVIAAQTGVSGSSRISEGAIVAGQVGIADHVMIGPGVILGAQCGVPSHKQIRGPGQLFWGTPARPITQYLKELASLARLVKSSRGAARRERES